MIASIEKQKTYLLRQLHQNRDQKLVPLMRQLETVDCYIAKAESLQVNHKTLVTGNKVCLSPSKQEGCRPVVVPGCR